MGRYAFFNTDFEYKFSFGIQDSSDILQFSGDYDDKEIVIWTQNDMIYIIDELDHFPYELPEFEKFEKTIHGTYELWWHIRDKNKNTDKKIPHHAFHPATFILITGKSNEEALDALPEEKKRILDNVFNPIENVDGKYIKFVLGSRVMNEGVSLENVSEVHILDAYYINGDSLPSGSFLTSSICVSIATQPTYANDMTSITFENGSNIVVGGQTRLLTYNSTTNEIRFIRASELDTTYSIFNNSGSELKEDK